MREGPEGRPMGSSGMRNAQPELKQSHLYDEVLISIFDAESCAKSYSAASLEGSRQVSRFHRTDRGYGTWH